MNLAEDTDFQEFDGPVAYALLPESRAGTFEGPVIPENGNFSFFMGDSITMIAEGNFTAESEKDAVWVLSNFGLIGQRYID